MWTLETSTPFGRNWSVNWNGEIITSYDFFHSLWIENGEFITSYDFFHSLPVNSLDEWNPCRSTVHCLRTRLPTFSKDRWRLFGWQLSLAAIHFFAKRLFTDIGNPQDPDYLILSFFSDSCSHNDWHRVRRIVIVTNGTSRSWNIGGFGWKYRGFRMTTETPYLSVFSESFRKVSVQSFEVSWLPVKCLSSHSKWNSEFPWLFEFLFERNCLFVAS